MTGKKMKKGINKRVKKNNKKPAGQKPKTYSGIIKSPATKKVTGRVFMKENQHEQEGYGWLFIFVTAILGIASALVPFGSGFVDFTIFNEYAVGEIWLKIGAGVIVLTIAGLFLEDFVKRKYL